MQGRKAMDWVCPFQETEFLGSGWFGPDKFCLFFFPIFMHGHGVVFSSTEFKPQQAKHSHITIHHCYSWQTQNDVKEKIKSKVVLTSMAQWHSAAKFIKFRPGIAQTERFGQLDTIG